MELVNHDLAAKIYRTHQDLFRAKKLNLNETKLAPGIFIITYTCCIFGGGGGEAWTSHEAVVEKHLLGGY